MIKITPKDRKLLKSSKVRDYLKEVEKILSPMAGEVQQAAMDAFVFGTGAVKMTPDGQIKRVDPQAFIQEARPVSEKDWQTAKKHAFGALQKVMAGSKDRIAQDREAWDILARAVAYYVAPVKCTGMWIEVTDCNQSWVYGIRRINGKGGLCSKHYTSRSACVWMAKRTAKALGLEYREGKA